MLHPRQTGQPTLAPLPHHLRPALAVLLDASEYAQDLDCNPDDFAVSLDDLYREGMRPIDLRWLIRGRYIKPAAVPGPLGLPAEDAEAGFLLTEKGLAWARLAP